MHVPVAIITVAILLILAGIHVYWGVGGSWGLSAVLPVRYGKPATIKPWMSLLVAIGLLLGAFLVLGRVGIMPRLFSLDLYRVAVLLIAALFAMRAAGDRKWVGFTKSETGTRFSRFDTWLYSPLCLAIAIMTFYLNRMP